MLLGYNHNINYKGLVFHIQTEDSGVKNPHIITLLYRDGVILSSKKTSYADILKIDTLEAVVEDLMKEQHKDMLRRLKSGEFDEKAFGASKPPEQQNTLEQGKKTEGLILPTTQATTIQTDATGIGLLFQETVQTTPDIKTDNPEPNIPQSRKQDTVSLDDAILNFFGASK